MVVHNIQNIQGRAKFETNNKRRKHFDDNFIPKKQTNSITTKADVYKIIQIAI